MRSFIGIMVIAWSLWQPLTALALPVSQHEVLQRCFAETGHCIQGRFLEFWNADLRYTTDPSQGTVNPWGGESGLTRHGYPITDEVVETLEDGKQYLVQYFERTRLEYHPENSPPYDVLIGAVGALSRPADPPTTALPAASNDLYEPVYFPETGHNLRGFFRVYWTLHGGLAQFGFPISEEFDEVLGDGHTYRVQYFERARLEYHQEIPAPNGVVLGVLGYQALAK